MMIDISIENISTVCNALRSTKQHLEWQLQYGIPQSKISFIKKEIIQNQLADVNETLRLFKYYEE